MRDNNNQINELVKNPFKIVNDDTGCYSMFGIDDSLFYEELHPIYGNWYRTLIEYMIGNSNTINCEIDDFLRNFGNTVISKSADYKTTSKAFDIVNTVVYNTALDYYKSALSELKNQFPKTLSIKDRIEKMAPMIQDSYLNDYIEYMLVFSIYTKDNEDCEYEDAEVRLIPRYDNVEKLLNQNWKYLPSAEDEWDDLFPVFCNYSA